MSFIAPGNRLRLALAVALGMGLVAAILWRTSRPGESRVETFFHVLERSGLAASLHALEQAAASDSVVLREGHQLAHALGRRAVLAGGGHGAVLRDCTPAFASGCFHGVVEAYVQSRDGVEMAELELMCMAAAAADEPGPVSECIHGLGHGILGASDFDVPRALTRCDALSRSWRDGCYTGVFMEAIDSEARSRAGHAGHVEGAMEHPRHGDGGLSADNPYAPCDAYNDPYAESCWLFQGFVILRRVGFDGAVALRTCDMAPARRVERCYESVGHQLTGLFQRTDAWVVEQCGAGLDELAPQCAEGAVLALAAMDWSGRRALAFCAGVPEGWKDECYIATLAAMQELASKVDRASACARVAADRPAVLGKGHCESLGTRQGATHDDSVLGRPT